MTKLLSSFPSASPSTIANTPNTPADDESRGELAAPLLSTVTAIGVPSTEKRGMGSPPLSLREEAVASQQQRRAELMAGKYTGTTATPAGLSPSHSSSRIEGDHDVSEQKQRRRSSPFSDREDSRNSSVVSKDSATPQRPNGGGVLSLLPLIPCVAGTAKDASLLELQTPSNQQQLQLQGPRTSSPSTVAGQPSVSPDLSARRQQRPSVSSVRDIAAASVAAASTSNMNASCGSFTLSPVHSTRDISATGLRGPIPENALVAASSQSPMSHGHDSHLTLTPAVSAYTATPTRTANSPRAAADDGRRHSAEAQPLLLPLLMRSPASLSSSSQGCRLTGGLLDANVSAAAVAATGAAAATSRSSSVNSMRRDDEGPQQASHSAATAVNATTVAAQSPPAPPSNHSNMESALRSFAPRGASSGLYDSDNSSRQQSSRFAQDENDAVTNQQASPLYPTEAEEVTFSMVPVIPTEASPHGTVPSATMMTDTSAFSNSHPSLPPPGGGGGVMQVAARPDSGSVLKNGTGDRDGSTVAAVTAARGATEARRPSDSVTEAVDLKAAKRRLKKEKKVRKAKKAKYASSEKAVAAAGVDEAKQQRDGDSAAAAGVVVAAGCRSDSEMQRRRQRKRREKQEKLKGLPTEEQRRYRAEHQRRRAAKKAQRRSNGVSPAPEAVETGVMPETQGTGAHHPTPPSSLPLSQPHDAVAASGPEKAAPNMMPAANPLDATQPPLSLTPRTPSLDKRDLSSSHDNKNMEEGNEGVTATAFAMTQSTPQLASTAHPSGNGNNAGRATLLGAPGQMRRCTSAKSPSAPPAVLSAAPPHGANSSPRNFRRRFLSEATPSPTPQCRTNGFLCLPVNGGAAEQQLQGQQLLPELQAKSPCRGAGDFDDDYNDNDGAAAAEQDGSIADESQLLAHQALYGSAATEASLRESVVTSANAAPFIAPHPPAAAAGSGAAAILELKHQQQQQEFHRRESLQSAPLPTSPNSVSRLADGANDANHDDGEAVRGSRASAAAAVDVAAPAANSRSSLNEEGEHQQNVHVSAAPSASFGAASSATPSTAGDGLHAVLEESSHSMSRDSEAEKDEENRHHHHDHRAQQSSLEKQQQQVDRKGAASASSQSSYYSYSHSRSHCRDGKHRAAANDDVDVLAGQGAAAVVQQKDAQPVKVGPSPQQQPRRSSPASSCLSLRSRSGDDDSGVGGSSSYSYSYTSSSGSSSSSSSSSAGSIMAEALPLKEGCTVAPPSAAFHDLKCRYACVAQLQIYAEPAVIHEWNLTEGCWGSVETSVVLNPQPFSKGNMRASYYMIDLRRLNCMLVAKRYLKSSVGEDQYFDDVSMHSIAGHWARVFNAMHPPKKVRFVPAAVLVLPKRNPPLILAMEPLLTGKFVKYNNNCGYVRRNARWTPQAFSHFTYQASNHELMVVDIQGVDDYYTDPQILSPDGEGYGRGNLGKKGIRRFLESHKCNDVCRAVGLPPLRCNSKGVMVAPLITPGRNAATPSLPATPGALERLAAASSSSGLKDERLPPKTYALSQQSYTSNTHGSERSPPQLSGGPSALLSTEGCSNSVNTATNAANPGGVHTRVGSLADSSRPGSERGKLGSSTPPLHNAHSHGSGHPSPGPAAAVKGLSSSVGPLNMSSSSNNNNNNTNGTNNAGGSVIAGPPHGGYGVKYVPYPRHAVVRPQSQYFTSTVAGGLMAVPPSANGSSALGTPSAQALQPQQQQQGQPPPPQQQQQQQPQHTPASSAGQAGTNGLGAAVPLLRPPTMGRPGGSGGPNGNNSNSNAYAANAINVSGGDNFASVKAQRTGSSLVGHTNSPRLESASGTPAAVPALHPHPPKLRLSSAAGVPAGASKPPSLNSGPQNTSHTNSSIAMIAVVQTAPEAHMAGGPHMRRQSFDRRPVFSAIEEKARSKQKQQHHHHRQ